MSFNERLFLSKIRELSKSDLAVLQEAMGCANPCERAAVLHNLSPQGRQLVDEAVNYYLYQQSTVCPN
ncbi:MAG: hypothetical protein IT324_05215 [Anaerolineae bacterium]|nr:hypothetical protein [Anaerolineae bacterium]